MRERGYNPNKQYKLSKRGKAVAALGLTAAIAAGGAVGAHRNDKPDQKPVPVSMTVEQGDNAIMITENLLGHKYDETINEDYQTMTAIQAQADKNGFLQSGQHVSLELSGAAAKDYLKHQHELQQNK